jgi:hypothetical protein
MKRQQSCGNKGQLPKQFSEKGNKGTRQPANWGKYAPTQNQALTLK